MDTTRTGLKRFALAAALLAALIAGGLSVMAFQNGAAPPGCGSGSGCGEVLGSRWSKLLGLPVSLGACVAYVLLALCVFRKDDRSMKLAAVLSHLVLGGVVWFVFLQLGVLKAVCPYCMVDHALGAAAAVAALMLARDHGVRWPSAAAGWGLAVLVAGIQVVTPAKVHTLDLPVGRNFDVVQNDVRVAGLLDGAFRFRIHEEAHIGDPEAERLVFLSVDYACPHCRRLHALGRELVADRPGEICLVVLPTPIHPDCNPAMTTVPDRFNESCALAELSLAVFEAAPSAWESFDAWLFETAFPRSLAEAQERAAPLLEEGSAEAEAAAREKMERNVRLFTSMPLEEGASRRVPVTWWVHEAPVMGPIEDADILWSRAAPELSTSTPSTDTP